MKKTRIYAVIVLLVAVGLAYFNYHSEFNPFNDSPLAKAFPALAVAPATGTSTTPSFVTNYPLKFGLDLRGGARLVYRADTSKIAAADVSDLMGALREVIERRLNPSGVSEIVVQTEVVAGDHRLSIELPGVYDLAAAKQTIGDTPTLEFKVERPNGETQAIAEAQVIFVFLLDRHMLRLDTKLKKECRPGARVVSYAFELPGRKVSYQTDLLFRYDF